MTGRHPAEPLAVQRLRLATISLAVAVLVFAQSAGQTAPDTKLDLVVSPLRFLRRSLTLWDPTGAAGQLQNQAYGYLFPMGPFFALGKLAALPAWVIQRGWESALVVAAFLGVVRLARLLGTEAFWPKVAAGLTYALAPRMLTELGSISSELMPVAVLPWLMIPLVRGSQGGSPRRAGTRAGLALLFAGGVNAAATLAVLPAPALWLLTRAPGPRRRRLAGWFAVGVALSCAWWLIPLLLLGKYSPRFLDYIESAQITTGPTSLIAMLSGNDHWQSYLGANIWPAGWVLVTVPVVVLATAGVAAAGLAGLARRDLPHRLFWRGLLLAGLVLLGMGFVAHVGPPAGSTVRTLLDGPLNAFRNVHKFDPLIRLPVAIGVGHLASRVRVPVSVRLRGMPVQARLLAGLLVLAVGALAISPAIVNRLVPQGRSTVEASWWRQTGDWLGSHDGAGRALVVPGAARPVYSWGATVDDALQPVATGPWTVRDGIPLAPAAYIRLLDDVSLRLAAGRRDDTLPQLLARSGIRYLIVRNDLDTAASGSTGQALLQATVDDTPGLSPVAGFGPDDRFAAPAGQLVDLGATVPRPMVQIYAVAGWAGEVGLLPAAGAVTATGSADQLGAVLAGGIPASSPVLFSGSGDASVVTDGIPRREANFGQTGAAQATLTAGQPFGQQRAAHDYLPPDPGTLSTMAYRGAVTDVRASSSGADAGALINPGPANGPWSALDGDPDTAWRTSSFGGPAGQWLSVAFDQPYPVTRLQLAFAAGLGYPSRIRITTDAGSRDSDVTPGPLLQTVLAVPGATRTLRITVLDATGQSVGIATLAVPGIAATRTLVVPTGRTAPDLMTFAVPAGGRSGCLTVRGRAACDPAFAAQGESDGLIDRTFHQPQPADYRPAVTVTARPGAALDQLLDAGNGIAATASSTDSADPRERPGAAVDGDSATGWVAAPGDLKPTLTLAFAAPRTVSVLRLSTDPDAPAARPTEVRVTAAGRHWTLPVPSTGLLRLPAPVSTSRLAITVLTAQLRVESSTLTGTRRLLPAGISEVSLDGGYPPAATAPVRFGCGSGLVLQVDGRPVPFQASATRAQLLGGAPFTATPCGTAPVGLARGTHDLRIAADLTLQPTRLVLTRVGATLAGGVAPGIVAPGHWGATDRTVDLDASAAAILVVRENANAGWQALLGGHRLAPVTVDGWMQGWRVPAGSRGTVTLRFTPQRTFDAGLVLGLLAVLALLWLAFGRSREDSAPAAIGEWPAPRWLPPVLALAGALALTGPVGLLVAATVLLAARSRRLPYWLAAVLVPLAALGPAYGHSGTAASRGGLWWVQLLCIAGVTLAVAAGWRQDGRENRRSRGRSKQNQDSVPSAVADMAVSPNVSQ
ncbi:MAG TPA: alpha-(1-_3)-arabinofuranosyltransferase family protein [Jatrophihabitans sp.]|nr:alpha-(1->3)-arabinofuranosyltransferase family protein [Jatrophihabitans sp.]